MAEKHPKRPRDLNQWAKRMVDIATGKVSKDDKAKGPTAPPRLTKADVAKRRLKKEPPE